MTVTQEAVGTKLYTIDKAHSEVGFQVRHLLTKVRGRFSDFAGTIQLDEQHPENSSVSLTIDASSVDTDTIDRDQHLRSADFFAVDTHPTLTFRSSRVVRKSADTYDVLAYASAWISSGWTVLVCARRACQGARRLPSASP